MNSLTISLKVSGIGDDIFEIETTGIALYTNKKHYIVTVHQGLPVKEVSFSINDQVYEFRDFITCGWNDLIIIPIDIKPSNLFVFKQFVRKQIDVSSKYYLDKHAVKYITNEFFSINMIPSNPMNIYYQMRVGRDIIEDGYCGKPIYNNNRLIGVIGKVMNDSLYIIPAIYILRSIEKEDNNTIYTIDQDISQVNKIGRYNVNQHNNTIYYKKMNSLISIDTFFALEGDKDTLINIHQNGTTIHSMFIPFDNNVIANSFNIDHLLDNMTISSEKSIQINSSFIHLMKLCYKDNDLIEKVFSNVERTRFNHIICNQTYSLYF